MKWLFCAPFLFLFFLCSCNGPYTGKNVVGAEDFVVDSYKIRQGKYSILEFQGHNIAELDAHLLKEYPDVVHEDDILMISIYHPSRTDIMEIVEKVGQNVGYRVQNGYIQVPDLGKIKVIGLNLEQVGEKIQEQYLQNIKDVEVFVRYKERLLRKVELAGLVAIPSIPVDGKIRLWEVLSLAKLPSSANLFKSYIIRDQKILPVDMTKLLKEGDMSQNIVMHGGDKIYIADPTSSYVLVTGEVGEQKALAIPNGFLSLKEALAMSGGIPYTGDKRYIQVIRGSIINPKIYTLNWYQVVSLPNDSLLVMPGDIIYVATSPIADWNRFISQVLPTAVGIETFSKSAKSIGINVGTP
jgi:polysaccharide export outer membrane protein